MSPVHRNICDGILKFKKSDKNTVNRFLQKGAKINEIDK